MNSNYIFENKLLFKILDNRLASWYNEKLNDKWI